MAAGEAVAITERRALEGASAQERERVAHEYAERHLDAAAAASGGFVDEVVEPDGTRDRLIWALAALETR